MSLINEALRKAQSQRAQASGLGNDPGTGNQPMGYADRPSRFGLMIGLSLFIVVLLALIAGLVFILLDQDTARSTPQTAAAEPAMPAAEATSEPPAATDPAVTKTETAETTQSEPAAPEPEIVEAPVVAAEPNPEIIDWLAQSTITGVRITSSSSKVILNNKGFSPGDMVNTELGLKVSEIEPKRIILIDANEVEYVKLF